MSLFFILLFFAFFAIFIYFGFGRPYKRWQALLLSSGYERQKELDKQLMEDLTNIFDPKDVPDVYKKEEGSGCISWIMEIDSGSSDEPISPYLVMSVKKANLTPMILTNYRYPVKKAPKIFRSVYEKTTSLSNIFVKSNGLELLMDVDDNLGLPTFIIMGKNEEDISLIPPRMKEVLQNWPPEKLDHVFLNGNYVILKPSGLRKVADWQIHLGSKDRMLKALLYQ